MDHLESDLRQVKEQIVRFPAGRSGHQDFATTRTQVEILDCELIGSRP